MTEIAIRDEEHTNGGSEVVAYMAPNSELLLWVQEAQQAARIATSLAKTSFVPQSLRGKAEDITAAILAGQELGLRPMASLRSMDIIQGTPALRAHAMRGLVQSKGHKVWMVEQTPARVVMRGQRREADGSFGPEQESVWDIARAELMGLTTKAEWKKQPQTMLTARATGEICRLIASDALYAMPYAVEELRTADRDEVEMGDAIGRVTKAEILASVESQAANTDAWPATPQIPGGGEE